MKKKLYIMLIILIIAIINMPATINYSNEFENNINQSIKNSNNQIIFEGKSSSKNYNHNIKAEESINTTIGGNIEILEIINEINDMKKEIKNAKDTKEIKESKESKESKELTKPKDIATKQVLDNVITTNYKIFFKNDIFIGDSIIKAMETYDFIDGKNICAKVGIGTIGLYKLIDNIEIQNPRNVFILCGINDMDGILKTQSFYLTYSNLIKKVKNKFPDSKIYVVSILPVLSDFENKMPYIKNEHIKLYNQAVIRVSEEEKIKYIDMVSLLNGIEEKYYEADGLHYKYTFYPLLLKQYSEYNN